MPITLPTSMRALEIKDGALVETTLPVPSIKEGEVLIRVAYAGVNRADQLQREGKYAPPPGASPLPGLEVSGRIVTKSREIKHLTAGDPVCALLPGGGYAEYVVVPVTQVLITPPKMGLRESAALPEAGATSMMALFAEGRLKAGERVLIHGGASGIGPLMCQIARRAGAEVYSTVGSDEKCAFLKRFGIIPINRNAAPFHEQILGQTGHEGVDLVIDTLGGPQLENHLRVLRPGGRLVTLAMLEGSALPAGAKMTRLLLNHLTWSGATLRNRSESEKAAYMEALKTRCWRPLMEGSIRPVIDSVFPLADAEKALSRMQERLHMGKILLEVAAN